MSEPRKPRGRMPAKIKVAVRFVPTDLFTYGATLARAQAAVLAQRQKAQS